MGRLNTDLLRRADSFADRTLDVAQALEKQRRYARVVDQIAGSGTAAGANLYEADQAISTKDFVKCVGIAVKEVNETKFWIRLVARRGWIKPDRLEPLEAECEELLRIGNAMIVRSRRSLPGRTATKHVR